MEHCLWVGVRSCREGRKRRERCWIPRCNLRPARIGNLDVIGNCYEYLIARFASEGGKKGGEFFTPPEVSTLMAKLVNPQPGHRISDPTCGSGSLLVKAAKEVHEKDGSPSNDFSLFGLEMNNATYALCRMNMFLHGIDSSRIVWGDTLNNPKLLENDTLSQFDVVVAKGNLGDRRFPLVFPCL